MATLNALFARLSQRLRQAPVRLIAFALVGFSGLAINSLALFLATDSLHIYYLWATVLATLCSTLWNFVLTERWVFSGRRGREGWAPRLGAFFLINQLALVVVRWPIMTLLTDGAHFHYVLSNGISIVAVLGLRFALADRWIWKPSPPADATAASRHFYSIHDLATIVSDVALPELEAFRTPSAPPQPTLTVAVEPFDRTAARALVASTRSIDYDEQLGLLGFRAQIEIGETIRVKASPLLRWSPHVLYTNLIEPILRWTLVQQGYALVHAACLALEDQAYLITARTDTGKTTTLLRLLSHAASLDLPAAFISDDLTLLSADGRVLTYPKPLTISAHTVRAINAGQLSRLERAWLPLQSRIHSRTGRQLAHQLARTRLPMATVNAIVQLIVPPPKYPVERLVAGVALRQSAQLAGVFIIQRGHDEVRPLAPDEKLQRLLQNGEDAYGFPPYPALEGFLRGTPHQDLMAVEQALIAEALARVPGHLISRQLPEWAAWLMDYLTAGAPEELPAPPDAEAQRLH